MTALGVRQAAGLVDELLLFARGRLIKAAQPSVERQRGELVDAVVPTFEEQLARYFRAFAERALPVTKAVAFRWDPDDIDWLFEERELGDLFATWYVRIGTEAYALVSEQIGVEVAWDLNARGVQNVLGSIAERVKEINDTTREALRALVADAIDRGDSVDDLGRAVRILTDRWAGFDREAYKAMLKDPDLPGWAKEMIRTTLDASTSRAHTIALTETGNALNLAAVNGYRDSGLVKTVRVLDGTRDDVCAAANGEVWTLDQAEAEPLGHPNCQRTWLPIPEGAS